MQRKCVSTNDGSQRVVGTRRINCRSGRGRGGGGRTIRQGKMHDDVPRWGSMTINRGLSIFGVTDRPRDELGHWVGSGFECRSQFHEVSGSSTRNERCIEWAHERGRKVGKKEKRATILNQSSTKKHPAQCMHIHTPVLRV
jgi:hypothetical protein